MLNGAGGEHHEDSEESLSFHLTSFLASSRRRVSIDPTAITVVTGPNNAGKSQLLLDIYSRLQGGKGVTVEDVTYAKSASRNAFDAWVASHSIVSRRAENMRSRYGGEFDVEGLWQRWQGKSIGNLVPLFVTQLPIDARLSLVSPSPTFSYGNENPKSPMQALVLDGKAERRLRDAVFETFGTPVALSRFGGKTVELVWGDLPEFPTTGPDGDYFRNLRACEKVADQGHGIRSFVGLLLTLLTFDYPLSLIDEPEVFLHPPHARMLGKFLAELQSDHQQIVVATHSLDLVQGILDGTDRANILRVERDGNINDVYQLDADDLKEMWADPRLRYSNPLNGLFHRGVVVCEADSDCQFYAEAMKEARRGQPSADLFFTHCGGKAGVAKLATALRAARIPVATVVDFDVLAGRELLDIVDAMGGKRETIDQWVKTIQREILDLQSGSPLAVVRRLIEEELSRNESEDGATLSVRTAVRIREITKRQSGWGVAKRTGFACLSGDGARAWPQLDAYLKSLRIHVVPVGELERWDPQVSKVPGLSWALTALAAESHRRTDVGQFVTALADSFGAPEHISHT